MLYIFQLYYGKYIDTYVPKGGPGTIYQEMNPTYFWIVNFKFVYNFFLIVYIFIFSIIYICMLVKWKSYF